MQNQLEMEKETIAFVTKSNNCKDYLQSTSEIEGNENGNKVVVGEDFENVFGF